MEGNTRLYNILLPIWIIIFVPSWLWLLLIPANYLIDRIILNWSLGDMDGRGQFCRKHNWKICLAGFVSDFAGAALLLITAVPLVSVTDNKFVEDAAGGIMMNPFTNVLSVIITLAAIAVSALCIYLLDKKILLKAGLDMEQAKKSATRLAVITAPYLYLIPSELLYRGGL
ncbi:MAG: hypothetical protein IJI11_06870 [Mogibacterium sp.]|nr:hypothetical protein [Mogibacterium sp.]